MQKFGRLCACPPHSSSSVLTICSKRSEIPIILSPHSRIGFPLNAIRFIAFCPIAPTDKTSNSNQVSGKSSNPTAGGDDRLFREQVEALRREIETEQKAKKQKPLNRFQKAWREHREKSAEISKHYLVTWDAVFIVGIGCAIIYIYFQYLYKEREKNRIKPNTMYQVKPEQLGLPPQDDIWKDFGGDWELISCETRELESSTQFRGKYVLLYWGYSNCPDICWEELEKITKVVTEMAKESLEIIPVFISIDPYRDNPDQVKKYLEGISPLIKGFTGSPEQIRAVSRKFRIYYMVSGTAKPTGTSEEDKDYLVDHSMRSYFIGPDGKFIKMFIRLENATDICKQIRELTGLTPKQKEKSWWNFNSLLS